MALFTDQITTTIEDLRKYESAVLDLASSEGVDLSTKLQLAHDEIGLEVAAFLQNCDEQSIGSVVVTEGLRHWCVLHTLSVLYRDLYSNQLNDRYLAKWREYEKLARITSARVFDYGVGITGLPVPRPRRPTLLVSAAPGAFPGAYYVTTAWLNARGEEGLASEVAIIELEPDLTVTVNPGSPASNAVSWNVFAGRLPIEMRLQNTTPIATDSMWTMPATGLVAGRASRSGQAADFLVRQNRRLPRG